MEYYNNGCIAVKKGILLTKSNFHLSNRTQFASHPLRVPQDFSLDIEHLIDIRSAYINAYIHTSSIEYRIKITAVSISITKKYCMYGTTPFSGIDRIAPKPCVHL